MRKIKLYKYQGKEYTLKELGYLFKMKPTSISWHYKHGKSLEEIRDFPITGRHTYFYKGERKTVQQLADIAGVCKSCMKNRLLSGMSVEDAVSTPTVKKLTYNGKTMTVKEWSIETGLSVYVIHSRLNYGWSVEKTLNTPKGPRFGHPRRYLTYNGVTKSCAEWAEELEISLPLLLARVNKYPNQPEKIFKGVA